MIECNELCKQTITIIFTDENGAAVIPASFTWRLQEPISGADIVAATTVVPTGSTHSLVINAAFNICSNGTDELRRITVIAAGLAAAEYIYKLHKLKGI